MVNFRTLAEIAEEIKSLPRGQALETMDIQKLAELYGQCTDLSNELGDHANALCDLCSAAAQQIFHKAREASAGQHSKFEVNGQPFTIALRNGSYFIKRGKS